MTALGQTTMQHLLSTNDLTDTQIQSLLSRAKTWLDPRISSAHTAPQYPNQHIAALFFEPSTRTRCSFDIAAKNLGMHFTYIDSDKSALTKGETLTDMLLNLHALGYRAAIIRHPSNDIFDNLVTELPSDFSLINAGNGCSQHPSQALGDILTMTHHKDPLAKRSIAIIGDLIHSRVFASLLPLLIKLGTQHINLIAPKEWLPTTLEQHPSVHCFTSLEEGLQNTDIVMTLRVQRERLTQQTNLQQFQQAFCLTEEKLLGANPGAIVMHPGPFNPDIEITTAVAKGKQSVILDQVKFGVAMKTAIIEQVLANE